MVFPGRYQTSLGARNAASQKSRSAENWKIAELLVFSGSLGKSEKSLGNSKQKQPETIDLNPSFGVEQGSSFPIAHCFEEEAFGFWRSPFLLRRWFLGFPWIFKAHFEAFRPWFFDFQVRDLDLSHFPVDPLRLVLTQIRDACEVPQDLQGHLCGELMWTFTSYKLLLPRISSSISTLPIPTWLWEPSLNIFNRPLARLTIAQPGSVLLTPKHWLKTQKSESHLIRSFVKKCCSPVFTPKNHVFSRGFSPKSASHLLGSNKAPEPPLPLRHLPRFNPGHPFSPTTSRFRASQSPAQRLFASFLARLCDAKRPWELRKALENHFFSTPK